MTKSEQLFAEAQQVLPGGVNSPVRACRAVDTYPRFLDHGMGSHVWDVDGNEYIDLIGSWGPLILGHCCQAVEQAVTAAISKGLSFGAPTAAEVEMAQLVCRMTGLEMVRMVNSGTEAVMSALRLARGATGRGKIIKFAGCYHGHSDAMLVKAGSGALTGGAPDSAGVPADIAADTLTASYNDLAGVEALLLANPGQVAPVFRRTSPPTPSPPATTTLPAWKRCCLPIPARWPLSLWSRWPPTWAWCRPSPASCRACGSCVTSTAAC